MTIDGEQRLLVEGREMEVKVNLNLNTTVKLALYGGQERVENLFRETRRAMKRLKLKEQPGDEPFKAPPEGTGSEPNIHDVKRWLDSLRRTRKFRAERKVLRQLHATCKLRVRPHVLVEDDSPKGLH